MAELVVYLAGEFLAEQAIAYFAIGKEAIFLRAAIRAGSFVLTTKAAQILCGTAKWLIPQLDVISHCPTVN